MGPLGLLGVCVTRRCLEIKALPPAPTPMFGDTGVGHLPQEIPRVIHLNLIIKPLG